MGLHGFRLDTRLLAVQEAGGLRPALGAGDQSQDTTIGLPNEIAVILIGWLMLMFIMSSGLLLGASLADI